MSCAGNKRGGRRRSGPPCAGELPCDFVSAASRNRPARGYEALCLGVGCGISRASGQQCVGVSPSLKKPQTGISRLVLLRDAVIGCTGCFTVADCMQLSESRYSLCRAPASSSPRFVIVDSQLSHQRTSPTLQKPTNRPTTKLKSALVLSWPPLGSLLQIHPLQHGQRACHPVRPQPKAPRQNPPTHLHPSCLPAPRSINPACSNSTCLPCFRFPITPCSCAACCLVTGLVFPIGRNGRGSSRFNRVSFRRLHRWPSGRLQ
jgi:hypothetical protein